MNRLDVPENSASRTIAVTEEVQNQHCGRLGAVVIDIGIIMSVRSGVWFKILDDPDKYLSGISSCRLVGMICRDINFIDIISCFS